MQPWLNIVWYDGMQRTLWNNLQFQTLALSLQRDKWHIAISTTSKMVTAFSSASRHTHDVIEICLRTDFY